MTRTEIYRKVWTDPRYFICYGLGSGLLPKMPGTWGTAMAVSVYCVLAKLPVIPYMLCIMLLGLYAISACDQLSKEIGVHDDPGMNIDEFIGYLVTMIGMPVTGWAVVLGFAYFRLFDIWKPWPIRWFDKNVGGGFGMIIDDVIAGLAAMIALHITGWIGAIVLPKIL